MESLIYMAAAVIQFAIAAYILDEEDKREEEEGLK